MSKYRCKFCKEVWNESDLDDPEVLMCPDCLEPFEEDDKFSDEIEDEDDIDDEYDDEEDDEDDIDDEYDDERDYIEEEYSDYDEDDDEEY